MLECWAISTRNHPNSETYFIAKEGPISSTSSDTLQLGQWRSGQADLRLATETQGYAVIDGPVLVPGEWYHLAATYNSQAEGDNLMLYVNGINVGYVRAERLVRADRGPLYLGGSKDVRKPGSVTLDEVRIWDPARTESEIVSNMNQALADAEAGLAAWYPLDGNTRDLSGNGHHGVLLYKERFVSGKLGSPELPVEPRVIFEESFEALPAGGDLIGQGGWAGFGPRRVWFQP